MTKPLEPLPPAGTRIRNPFNGETYVFTVVDEDAAEFEFDVYVEPGGMMTGTGRQHIHPYADEEFIMKEGRLRLMVDGAWHELGPGESLLVPRGTPHLFRNGHDGETLFTARFRPGMQFLRMFLCMGSNIVQHPEWYDDRGEPPLLLQALTFGAFRGQGYAADIPVWLQTLVFAVLTPIALLKGYRLAVRPQRRRFFARA
ncbi:MAG: cupin domain-containing protein [Rhodobacteraceae bacterium]|nr:cupin domain-containing protein [Paracoccaceae bacterium]